MKNLNCLLFIVMLLFGCAFKKVPYNLKEIKKKQVTMNGDFKSIDTAQLNSYKRIHIIERLKYYGNEKNDRTILYVSNISEHEKIYMFDSDGYRWVNYDNQKQQIKKVEFTSPNGSNALGWIQSSEKIDSTFNYVELYYPSGNISQKMMVSPKYNLSIGKIYKFNRNGEPTEVIDTEEGYLVSFTEILKFCKNENLPNEHVSISRSKDEKGQKMWNIDVKYHWGDDIYMINGATGDVTKRLIKLYVPGYESVPFQPKKKIRVK